MTHQVSEPSYRSFLVRLWRAEAAWQGEIEHIQSGTQWRFASVDEVLAFLARQASEPAPDAQPPGDRDHSGPPPAKGEPL